MDAQKTNQYSIVRAARIALDKAESAFITHLVHCDRDHTGDIQTGRSECALGDRLDEEYQNTRNAWHDAHGRQVED